MSMGAFGVQAEILTPSEFTKAGQFAVSGAVQFEQMRQEEPEFDTNSVNIEPELGVYGHQWFTAQIRLSAARHGKRQMEACSCQARALAVSGLTSITILMCFLATTFFHT